MWVVEYTDQFECWWENLDRSAQRAIDRRILMLENRGPTLPFPYSSNVESSRHGNMRELRIQVGGEPYRIFYAFDPRRVALLLIGGNKVGDGQFYEWMTSQADRLYDDHLVEIGKEERRADREK